MIRVTEPKKILLTHSSSFGECAFLIGSVEYKYKIDAVYLEKVERLSRRAPGRALNFVKQRGSLIKGREEKEHGTEDHGSKVHKS